jgi:hypothetical protein
VLNIIMPVGRGWDSRSSTLSDHARYLAQSANIMRHTIGATRRSTFSRRACSPVQLIPWFPIAAPNNSARTRERRVVPRGQGAMGQASQSRAQRAVRPLLAAPFEGVIEGGADGGGGRVPTVKDPESP